MESQSKMITRSHRANDDIESHDDEFGEHSPMMNNDESPVRIEQLEGAVGLSVRPKVTPTPRPRHMEQGDGIGHSMKLDQVHDRVSHMRDDITGAIGEMSGLVTDALKEVSAGMKSMRDVMMQQPVLSAANNFEAQHPPPNRMSEARGPSRSYAGPSVRRRPHSSYPVEDPSSSTDEQGDQSEYLFPRRGGNNYSHGARLPPFTGKDDWKVWYNRFSDVADHRGWNEGERLNELLPKLQGIAGEFVYGQLNRSVRTNLRLLVTELEYRFRKIETSKTFAAKFSHRNQKAGETYEEYAAELKRLYDKAHPKRDKVTRQEDLLRRFLDGLLDDRIRTQVEYVKDPEDIDQAVMEVINFVETKRTGYSHDGEKRGRVRVTHDDETSDDDDDRIARLPIKTRGNFKHSDVTKTKETVSVANANTAAGAPIQGKELQTTIQNELKDLTSCVAMMKTMLEKMNKGNSSNDGVSSSFKGRRPERKRTFQCFRCGKEGHYANDCNSVVTGQVQITTQPSGVSTVENSVSAVTQVPTDTPNQ